MSRRASVPTIMRGTWAALKQFGGGRRGTLARAVELAVIMAVVFCGACLELLVDAASRARARLSALRTRGGDLRAREAVPAWRPAATSASWTCATWRRRSRDCWASGSTARRDARSTWMAGSGRRRPGADGAWRRSGARR